jgi:polar amino acid transport system substrate-binding protein
MKKIIALVLALVTLTLCAFSLASCKKDEEELIIGITYFAPMNYKVDGKLVGFETEFAEAVCKEIGMTPKFQEIDWEAKEQELNGKTIDCIWNGMTITDERAENMAISTPYMKNKQVLVVKAENIGQYTAESDLTGKSLVAEKKSAGETAAKTDAYLKKADYTGVDKMATALMEVASGTADACVIDYVTALGSIGEGTDYEELVVVEALTFGAEEQYGIAFRKGEDDAELVKKVNDAIKKLAENGELKKIAEKYNLEDYLLVGNN